MNSTLDVAGNSISLLGQEEAVGDPKTFLGLEYAQYAKADIDARLHFNFGKDRQHTLATRLFAGYGLAYGNSEVIPFVKQYFAYFLYRFRLNSTPKCNTSIFQGFNGALLNQLSNSYVI